MAGFINGLLAGYGIAIPVGAVSILIVTIGMRYGFRTGFMAGAGAATAVLIYATAASLGGAALSLLLAPISLHLRVAGGAALLGLAVYGTVSGMAAKAGAERKPARGPGATYAQLLGITLVNPLTVVYFTALVLGRGGAAAGTLADRALFVPGAALASLSWQTLIAGLGAALHARLSDRFRRWAVIAGNLIVAGLGVRIIVQALAGR
jgi:threonine/homoserine/homoserine lactone efflux protein